MKLKNLIKKNPHIENKAIDAGYEWTGDELVSTIQFMEIAKKNISEKHRLSTCNPRSKNLRVKFNNKTKNLLKELERAMEEMRHRTEQVEKLLRHCYEKYTLLSIDSIHKAFIHELDNSNRGRIERKIHENLEILSIKKEITIFEEANDYPDIFPKARKRKRKIIAYLGETNSGKTYQAMSQIANSSKAAYLAPLRLLAYENYNYLNNQGIYTNMITGEEKILEHEQPQCVSSTVECFNFEKEYDTVVIDEIQMIDDPDRGAFFIQALVGANADNIILTGPKGYEKRLKEIVNELDEEFEVVHFDRRSQLKSIDKPTDLKDIPSNSAIVVFSRKDIFNVRQQLPKHLKSSVIYGALGHQVRTMQAEKFINKETDILITTDAIGMGLNLPIERIFFYTDKKFNGKTVTHLSDMLTKQIAGRAGRSGIYDIGYYGAFDRKVLDFVKDAVNQPLCVPDTKFSVLPTKNYIEKLMVKYRLSSILLDWSRTNKFSDKSIFKNAKLENKIKIAQYLEAKYPEKVKKYYEVINCPVDFEKDESMFKNILKQMFDDGMLVVPEERPINTSLSNLETFVKYCNILLWFVNHFEEFCLNGSNKFLTELQSVIINTNELLDKKLTKNKS